MTSLHEQLQTALRSTFTIERELGGGGMSRVFLAHETALNRPVVIKVLSTEVAATVSAERFAREMKLAARLQQANIVPLLNTGEADGVPWYSMPYVRDESLRARLVPGRPMAVGEATHILRDVARALAFAHGEGVVHRDIKPENILLSGGAAVVTDFGIAKALSVSRTQDASPAMTMTQAGMSVGTPAYMAPEQAAGDPAVDHRADIYAWGVVAWELIAGMHPFASRTSAAAMIAAQLSEIPAPLTAAPPVLASLVARCLEKDPARRPQSANELLAALDRADAGGERPMRRRVSLRNAAIVVAAVAIVAAAWLLEAEVVRRRPRQRQISGRAAVRISRRRHGECVLRRGYRRRVDDGARQGGRTSACRDELRVLVPRQVRGRARGGKGAQRRRRVARACSA